ENSATVGGTGWGGGATLRADGRVGRGVLERGLVGAVAAQLEVERPVVDSELLGVELDPVPVVARDHAGDRLLLRDGLADPHRHLAARAEPGTLRRVVDLDPHRADAERVARLPRP